MIPSHDTNLSFAVPNCNDNLERNQCRRLADPHRRVAGGYFSFEFSGIDVQRGGDAPHWIQPLIDFWHVVFLDDVDGGGRLGGECAVSGGPFVGIRLIARRGGRRDADDGHGDHATGGI